MYKVYYTAEAVEDLSEIHLFIAKNDYVQRANIFIRDIVIAIEGLREMPYRFRKSYYSETDIYRDMVIKGFTVIYKIVEEKRSVYIMQFFRAKNF